MSAQKTKASGVLGALLGILGMSAIAGILVTALVAPALAVTGLAANNSIGMFENLPSYIEPTALAQRSEIYAKDTSTGTDVLLAGVYDQNREEVGWDQVSQFVKDAVIAVEDPRFYSHGGIDIASAARAAVQNASTDGGGPGASTISMQYVRNIQIQKTNEIADPTARQKAFEEATKTTIDRKLKEMKLAIGLEKEFTKDQILLGYLNISNFGGTIYGIETAAQYYYGVRAADVTVAQAASLVSMVNEPNGLRIDEPDHPEKIADNQARRDKDVLPAMLKDHKITKAQFDEAIATPVTPNIQQPSTGCQTANGDLGGGFFCDYVSHIIKNDPAFGDTEDARWEKFKTGGYKIYTTMDVDLQRSAVRHMAEYIPKETGDPDFDLGSSMVTVEPGTGKVLTMVQNKDYNADPDNPLPTATAVNFSTDYAYGGSTGFPQGSTYKVFTLAEWLKNGHSLGDIVNGNSRPFNLSTFKNSCEPNGSQTYQSANDGGAAPGNVTVQYGTAQSVNNVFLSMAQKLDMCEITKTAESFGEHRADGTPMQQNVSGVLGTNEVAPLTVAAAFAGIAAGGLYCSPVAIERIVDASGADVPVPQTNCSQAVPKNVAATMAVGMRGPITGGTATSADTHDGTMLIGKTGTSDGEKHLWFAGASTRLATAIWTGNIIGGVSLRTYGRVMEDGGSVDQTRFGVWKNYMIDANAKYPAEDFERPDNSLINGVQITVPDVKGLPVPDAQDKLDNIGFDFADGGVVDSDAPAGTAAGTDPAAGTSVTKGSTVTVFTSNGLLKPIPPIAGKSLNDSANTLTTAGYRLGSTKTNIDPNCADPNKSIGSEPAAGTLAKPGDTVVIVMCKKQ
jgi:membrane peptidoglycan carboxypeptidase